MNSVNNNLVSLQIANRLNSHYNRLAASIERLSSGLRINSAADDAAGLAIRELMRADVATYYQGIRNINDAISLIQTADGALSVIDEKLIRMKELAEQAATGTYDSTQRLMIDSEFQAMASEIDRIANATDFNGIKLLDGSRQGVHDGSGLEATGALKVHFGTANDSAEDYYYLDVGDCTTGGLGLRDKRPFPEATGALAWINNAKIDYTGRQIILDIPMTFAGTGDQGVLMGVDFYQLPVGLENIQITSNAGVAHPRHKAHVCLFTKDGTQLTGPPMKLDENSPKEFWDPVCKMDGTTRRVESTAWWNGYTSCAVIDAGVAAGVFDHGAKYNKSPHLHDLMKPGASTTYGVGADSWSLECVTGINEIGADRASQDEATTDEVYNLSRISSDLVFFIGGHHKDEFGCHGYSLRIEADITETFLQKLQTWSGNSISANGELISIRLQGEAQQALTRIDDAIVAKDKVRAHLGAMQNRLENSSTNITTQAENLQAAEARISDADVAREMTLFVRNQILTQSAVAMLGQANSFPHMLSSLLMG